MSASADVLVVGAGIVGAACARALAAAGLRVAILDARRAGATAAGMGHLVTMDDNPAELALTQRSLQLWQGWREQLPVDSAWAGVGTLWVAANDDEMQEAQRKQARLAASGVQSDLLDAAALAREEPALVCGLAGGLRVPGDAIVYAPAVVRWLLQRLSPSLTVEHAEVVALEDNATVRLADGTRRSAAAVLLAAGVDAAGLCPELPLRPKKGHLAITDRYPGLVRHQLVELGYAASTQATAGISVAFNLQPRPTGQLLIGSSRQFDSADAQVDGAVLARMLRRALSYLPALAGLNAIRTWTGLRPATPDGLPILGAHPTRRGLWLALGHEGLGVTTAPATAELLAAAITGRGAATLDAAPYRAERFSGATRQAQCRTA